MIPSDDRNPLMAVVGVSYTRLAGLAPPARLLVLFPANVIIDIFQEAYPVFQVVFEEVKVKAMNGGR